jgi:hypothetical protein
MTRQTIYHISHESMAALSIVLGTKGFAYFAPLASHAQSILEIRSSSRQVCQEAKKAETADDAHWSRSSASKIHFTPLTIRFPQ